MFKLSKITVDTLLLTLKINIACGKEFRLSLINVQYMSFQVENFNIIDLHIYFKKTVDGYEISLKINI